MKKNLNIFLTIIIILMVGLVFLNLPADNTEEEKDVGGVMYTQKVTILDAVIATTTSNAFNIDGAKRVTLFLDQDFVGGTGLFSTTTYAVTTSLDGDTYITYNKLIENLANTNSQDITRVASKVVDDATDYYLTMDLTNDIFGFMKVTATTLTTGTPVASTTVTVTALIDY